MDEPGHAQVASYRCAEECPHCVSFISCGCEPRFVAELTLTPFPRSNIFHRAYRYYQEFAPAQVSKLSDRFVDYYITKNEYLNRTLKFKYGVDLEGNTALWYGVTHETETSVVLTRANKIKREKEAAARLVQFWR